MPEAPITQWLKRIEKEGFVDDALDYLNKLDPHLKRHYLMRRDASQSAYKRLEYWVRNLNTDDRGKKIYKRLTGAIRQRRRERKLEGKGLEEINVVLTTRVTEKLKRLADERGVDLKQLAGTLIEELIFPGQQQSNPLAQFDDSLSHQLNEQGSELEIPEKASEEPQAELTAAQSTQAEETRTEAKPDREDHQSKSESTDGYLLVLRERLVVDTPDRESFVSPEDTEQPTDQNEDEP